MNLADHRRMRIREVGADGGIEALRVRGKPRGENLQEFEFALRRQGGITVEDAPGECDP